MSVEATQHGIYQQPHVGSEKRRGYLLGQAIDASDYLWGLLRRIDGAAEQPCVSQKFFAQNFYCVSYLRGLGVLRSQSATQDCTKAHATLAKYLQGGRLAYVNQLSTVRSYSIQRERTSSNASAI